jgi:hypothetical protein
MPKTYTMQDILSMAQEAAKKLKPEESAVDRIDRKAAEGRIGQPMPEGSMTMRELLTQGGGQEQADADAAEMAQRAQAQEAARARLRDIVAGNIKDATWTTQNSGALQNDGSNPYIIPPTDALRERLGEMTGETPVGYDVRMIDKYGPAKMKLAAESLGITPEALVEARRAAEGAYRQLEEEQARKRRK